MTLTLRLLLVAIAGILVASCSSQSGESTGTTLPSDSTTTTSASADPGFPLAYPGPPLTIDILTEGILHIDSESNCVTLESPTDVLVAAVPEGAAIDMSDAANPALVLEGCRPMYDGELIQFRGVGDDADEEALRQQLDSGYLQQCGATNEQLALIGYCTSADRR